MNIKKFSCLGMLLISSACFSSSYVFRASSPGVSTGIGDTCVEILEKGNSKGDGNYLVDPDGNGGNSSKEAYCLMSAGGFMLYDSFSNETGSLGSSPKAYNQKSIKTVSQINEAGYSYYLTNIDNTRYALSDIYLQFYYSSTPTGYITKSMPSWSSQIRVDITNETYSVPSYVSFGGTTHKLEPYESRKEFVMSGSGVLKVYEEDVELFSSMPFG